VAGVFILRAELASTKNEDHRQDPDFQHFELMFKHL
jgi:hypothetical protein